MIQKHPSQQLNIKSDLKWNQKWKKHGKSFLERQHLIQIREDSHR